MSIYPSRKLYRILKAIIVLLILTIAGGTGIAYFQKSFEHTEASVQHTTLNTVLLKEHALFGDIGQLRVATVDTPPITIVLSPFLEYKADDTAFQEELVQKKEILKHTILEYFAIQSAYRISSEPSHSIKEALLPLINAQLVLGKIKNIYFEDFVILY